ncbi:MAG: DegT/DnrJ/EryC1/StrS family aminotransferase [Gammaproteobacteria bacterium]|nr:DegT/DnrJ/EryC1/StrS family aminotransferase [Gammaproteobacteria bacterium]
MVDLKGQYLSLKQEIDQAVLDVLANCHYILGPNVQALEKETAHYLNAKHTVTCANGTDALHLALLAAGIGAGDEVITTPFTFIATAEAICYVGATPVFVDIEADTFNISVNAIAKAITKKTKAILPVHLFGQPANLAEIQKLADAHKLLVIEDCAQSFGASINKQQTGSFGALGCFSFFPSKNLGGFGDGGLISTNDDHYAERLLQLRNHGSKVRYYHDIIGYNSRLDEIQAAILRVKLKHIDSYNQNRRRVAQQYTQQLNDLPLRAPIEDGIGVHIYHQYTTLLNDANKRADVMQHLTQQGIACAVYYPVPLHQQKAFAQAGYGALPITEDVTSRCLSLPIFPEMTDAQIQIVCQALKDALA